MGVILKRSFPKIRNNGKNIQESVMLKRQRLVIFLLVFLTRYKTVYEECMSMIIMMLIIRSCLGCGRNSNKPC